AVAVSPATDATGLVDKAMHDALTTDQIAAVPTVVEVLARLHPEVNRDDYRRGAAIRYWDNIIACAGSKVHDREAALKEVRPQDVAPATPQAADRLRSYLAEWALP